MAVDDQWLFDGDAWLARLRETAPPVIGCGDPDCACQDGDDLAEDPGHAAVTMTDGYDVGEMPGH